MDWKKAYKEARAYTKRIENKFSKRASRAKNGSERARAERKAEDFAKSYYAKFPLNDVELQRVQGNWYFNVWALRKIQKSLRGTECITAMKLMNYHGRELAEDEQPYLAVTYRTKGGSGTLTLSACDLDFLDDLDVPEFNLKDWADEYQL